MATANPAQILKCDCKHKEQDKLHGQNNRVNNINTKNEAVCTICGGKKRLK